VTKRISATCSADLEWLRRTGLAAEVARRAAAGTRVLGICGGLQMLGMRLIDGVGVDGSADGLGLLPVETEFEREKVTQHVVTRFGELPQPWSELSYLEFDGYEIRHGRTQGPAFAAGNVLGLSAHGLFESPEACRALLGSAPPEQLDRVFDRLADALEEHVDLGHVL
jgi:adenosylcobyric acid synthase